MVLGTEHTIHSTHTRIPNQPNVTAIVLCMSVHDSIQDRMPIDPFEQIIEIAHRHADATDRDHDREDRKAERRHRRHRRRTLTSSLTSTTSNEYASCATTAFFLVAAVYEYWRASSKSSNTFATPRPTAQ